MVKKDLYVHKKKGVSELEVEEQTIPNHTVCIHLLIWPVDTCFCTVRMPWKTVVEPLQYGM